jgi:hypothetical protein
MKNKEQYVFEEIDDTANTVEPEEEFLFRGSASSVEKLERYVTNGAIRAVKSIR